MKFKLLNFLFFLLIVAPIHAKEWPSNAPTDLSDWQFYTVIDGKIYIYGQGGSHVVGFRCSTEADARQIASLWPEWCADYESYYGCSPVVRQPDYILYRMDPPLLASPIVEECSDGSWVVIFYISQSDVPGTHNGTLYDFWWSSLAFSAWFTSHGCTFSEELAPECGSNQIFGFYADAEYSEEPEPDPEPQEPTPPEGLADGCITYYQGAWRYTSECEGPTADVIFRGPSLYADTEEDAERCASQFAAFLATYDWPWYGEPAVLPWSEPKVYKCYVIRDGAVSFVFWRVFFQDYTGDKIESIGQYDSAYMQCLNDYGLQGAGTGGYNVIGIYGPSAVASASNTGSAQLNGTQLAQSESGMSSVKLTSGGQDVTVTQYTVQKVDAEGDTVGASEVTSEASISEGADGSINVTNNTTINTNIELGDAPAVQVYTVPREETEKAVAEYDKYAEDPYLVYWLKDESSEASAFFPYKLDIEKIWQDVLDAFYDFIPWDQIRYKVDQFTYSGQLPILSYRIPFMAGSDQFYELAVNYNQLAGNAVIMQIRGILSAIMWLACFGSCLWIWNV